MRENQKFTFTTQQMAVVAVFIALHIAVSRFSIMPTQELRISFTFLVVGALAVIYGPWVTGLACVGADLLTGAMFGVGGPFFPGFTFTAFLGGFIYGLFLHRKNIRWHQIVLAVGVNTVVSDMLLNTLWLNILYKTPYWALFVSRLPKNAIMFFVQIALLGALLKLPQLDRVFSRLQTENAKP